MLDTPHSVDPGVAAPFKPDPDPIRQAVCDSEDVDKICELFELAWEQHRTGGQPRPTLREYLSEAPFRLVPHLLSELVRVEVEQRQQAGEAPNRHEYLDPFPGFRDCLETVLNEMLPPEPSRVLRYVGRYQIDEEVGEGGMAFVYRATDPQLKRKIAIKMIKGVSGEEKSRILAEAHIIAKLTDDHILKIYESGEIDGSPFLALEYCEGGTLADRFHGTPQPAREAASLLATIAGAVQCAHEQSIIHRDLKPANILLGYNSAVKVSDFGLAKRLDDDSGQTKSGAIVGTPSYMAPEQAFGRSKDVGPTADVYSLGAILYESLTGRPPLKGATPHDTLDMVRNQEPVPVRRLQPKVPRDLETICLKCLHKEPSRRYSTAKDLGEDLQRFLNGEPIKARPVGALEKAVRWIALRPKTLASVAAALLIVVVGYLIIATQNRAQRANVLLDSLASTDVENFPQLIGQLSEEGDYFVPMLSDRLNRLSPEDGKRWRYTLALLAMSGERRYVEVLMPKLIEASPDEVLVISEFLRPHEASVTEQLWKQTKSESPEIRFRVGCALAKLDPDSPRWADIAEDVARSLVRQNLLQLRACVKALRPVSAKLNTPLRQIYCDDTADDSHRTLAASVLIEFNRGDRPFVAELLMDADEKRFTVLRPEIARLDETAIGRLTMEIQPPGPSQAIPSEAERLRLASRRANAGLCLLLLNRELGRVWKLLKHSGDPTARNFFIRKLASAGADWRLLEKELRRSDRNAPVCFALALALGQFDEEALAPDDRMRFCEWLRTLYCDHPDPGVHAAIRWLLERWGFRSLLEELDRTLAKTWAEIDAGLEGGQPLAVPRWAIVRDGDHAAHEKVVMAQTFILLPAPGLIRMGSEPSDPERDETLPNRETLHWRIISRPYAIAMYEVTLAEFLRFDPSATYRRPAVKDDQEKCRYPANSVTWYKAMAYCDWLSAKHALPENQWCCPKGTVYKTGLDLPGEYLHRTGYRLPTEAEWEYACRAGTTTSRYCGALSLLPDYAWDYTASRGLAMNPVGSRKPNDFGLFDTLGNAIEWTIDRYQAYKPTNERDAPEDAENQIQLSDLEKDKHVARGGSFYNPIERVRAPYRYLYQPSSAVENLGFRVVRTLPTSKQSNRPEQHSD